MSPDSNPVSIVGRDDHQTLTQWEIRLDRWQPPSINTTLGRHWRAIHRAKLDAADIIGIYSAIAQVPKITLDYRPRRHVVITAVGWSHKGSVLPDPDNVLKITLDAMVRARLLVDDADEYCTWERPALSCGRPTLTTIVITDIGMTPPISDPLDDPYTRRLFAAKTKGATDAQKTQRKRKRTGGIT